MHPNPYACQQPALIASWRGYFNDPNLWFGFVEMEPWVGVQGATLPEFRKAQLVSAETVHNVGFAITTDIGDPKGPDGKEKEREKGTPRDPMLKKKRERRERKSGSKIEGSGEQDILSPAPT